MKNKKLLILGGKPIGSFDIVKYAKKKGIYTIVTDYLDVSQSIAKQIADEHWNISTHDVTRLCKKINQTGVDAVFTGAHEPNIFKTLEICEELGFHFYATKEQMRITSNKNLYKKLFSDFGMPIIPQYFVGKVQDFEERVVDEYPVIIKPIDGSSGFGVKICRDKNELKTAISNSAKHSRTSQVEKKISAPEITIFYIIKDSKIALSAMADRETYSFKDGVIPLPVKYIFPSVYLKKYIETFNEKVIKSFEHIGLKNGMVFLQAFWEKDQCYIYDIGFRLTGTQEYNILSKVCGYNPLEMLVDYALTGKMGDDESFFEKVEPFLHGKYASNVTFLMRPATIAEIEGVNEVEKINGVEKVVLNHQIGDEIPDAAEGTLVQVIVRVFLINNTLEELNNNISQIKRTIKVYDTNGDNVLII